MEHLDLREIVGKQERMEVLGYRVLQVQWVPLETQDLQDCQGTKDLLGSREIQGCRDQRAKEATEDQQDPKETLVKLGLLDQVVLRERMETLEDLVPQDLPEGRDVRVPEGLQGSLEGVVLKVFQVWKENQELQVLPVHLDPREIQLPWHQLQCLEEEVNLEHQVLQDQEVLQVLQEAVVQLEEEDLMGHEGPLDLMERRVVQEGKDYLEEQGVRENQERMEIRAGRILKMIFEKFVHLC